MYSIIKTYGYAEYYWTCSRGISLWIHRQHVYFCFNMFSSNKELLLRSCFNAAYCRQGALTLFAAQRFPSPVVERPAWNGQASSCETCRHRLIHEAPPLLPALLQVLLPAQSQNVKTSKYPWSDGLSDSFCWCFSSWDGGGNQFHPISILQASNFSKASWVSELWSKVTMAMAPWWSTVLLVPQSRSTRQCTCRQNGVGFGCYRLLVLSDVKMHNTEVIEGSFRYSQHFTKYF